MISTRYMYLRPGNMFRDFAIEDEAEAVGPFGRPKPSYGQKEKRILRGCLSDASENDRERWKQLQHPVTHTIVQRGAPLAKEEDRLISGERLFIVHAIDDCGGLGITTIYYAEERKDVR